MISSRSAALIGMTAFALAQMASESVFAQVKPSPDMAKIAGGTFTMGSDSSAADEAPAHIVDISPFWMAKYEVTVADFAAFVDATGYTSGPGCNWYVDGKLTTEQSHNWRIHGFAQADNHPVVCVSWMDAQAYIAWLNDGGDRTYRLPTEAEWEYVAQMDFPERAYKTQNNLCDRTNAVDATLGKADTGLFSFGNSKFYNSDDERFFACDDGAIYTAPVGQYAAGPSGVYDILGNVWELIQDCGSGPYSETPRTGAAYEPGGDDTACQRRIIRGGSWNTGPAFMTVTNRSSMDINGRNWGIGFRLAADE